MLQNRIKNKRIKRNENSSKELWDNMKCTNLQIIGAPEEEGKEKDSD